METVAIRYWGEEVCGKICGEEWAGGANGWIWRVEVKTPSNKVDGVVVDIII